MTPRPAPFTELHRRDQQQCTLALDGVTYTIAPTSLQLLDALTAGDPLAIVPGLCIPEARHLAWLAQRRDSNISLTLLRRAGADTTSALLGFPWQVGWQLASLLSARWIQLCAELARLGIEPATTPAHRTLAAVYGILTTNLSAEDAIKIDDVLWAWPEHLPLGEHTPATDSSYVRTVSGGRKLKRRSAVIKPPA